MKRYLIEREIPGAGAMSGDDLCHAAQKSNAVLAELAPKVQWQQSYAAADRVFCIYLADSPDSIREHARLAGFPANRIIEVPTVFDPTTARG